ncbi:hypothetical protein L3X38_025935 [Prunus dulcis]|uniref:Uncharacterized protein n=1 Tax=Prunus dulcis TaxID=3755 RepID=A0AAD4W3E7_PRUDU|nr:hypothetical protein L3X38_025935 [Prunus dulcis]
MVCGDSGGLAGSMVVTVLGEEEEAALLSSVARRASETSTLIQEETTHTPQKPTQRRNRRNRKGRINNRNPPDLLPPGFPLVLKVRKEAMNSLSGNGSEKRGMVSTVDAANSTALEMFFTV